MPPFAAADEQGGQEHNRLVHRSVIALIFITASFVLLVVTLALLIISSYRQSATNGRILTRIEQMMAVCEQKSEERDRAYKSLSERMERTLKRASKPGSRP
jgi:hypothetical protein